MATLKLVLERSRALKDGSYSVVFQIIHRRTKKLIYTPFRSKEFEFNALKEKFNFISNEVKTKTKVDAINRKIKQQRKTISAHILELESRGCDYLVTDIISRYRIQNDSLYLIGYFESQIERKNKMGKIGSVRTYKATLSSIVKFIKFKNVLISDLDFAFIRSYEQYLIKSNISANTICFYMRNFKSIYNQAVVDGYSLQEQHPFKYVRTRLEKTIKRALSKNDLLSIRDMDLQNRCILEFARDIFLFSFYSRGMAMVDIAYLSHKNINNTIISYHRHKTNQHIEIYVTSELSVLIEKYRSNSEYIFPILRGNDPQELYRLYRLSLERTNRHLKEIGKMLKLNIPLTTYVARHSWATRAKEYGISTSIISEALGHTSEKTTQIYLKAFDNDTINDANEKVTKLLN